MPGTCTSVTAWAHSRLFRFFQEAAKSGGTGLIRGNLASRVNTVTGCFGYAGNE